jgi:hypothetical protein
MQRIRFLCLEHIGVAYSGWKSPGS